MYLLAVRGLLSAKQLGVGAVTESDVHAPALSDPTGRAKSISEKTLKRPPQTSQVLHAELRPPPVNPRFTGDDPWEQGRSQGSRLPPERFDSFSPPPRKPHILPIIFRPRHISGFSDVGASTSSCPQHVSPEQGLSF